MFMMKTSLKIDIYGKKKLRFQFYDHVRWLEMGQKGEMSSFAVCNFYNISMAIM